MEREPVRKGTPIHDGTPLGVARSDRTHSLHRLRRRGHPRLADVLQTLPEATALVADRGWLPSLWQPHAPRPRCRTGSLRSRCRRLSRLSRRRLAAPCLPCPAAVRRSPAHLAARLQASSPRPLRPACGGDECGRIPGTGAGQPAAGSGGASARCDPAHPPPSAPATSPGLQPGRVDRRRAGPGLAMSLVSRRAGASPPDGPSGQPARSHATRKRAPGVSGRNGAPARDPDLARRRRPHDGPYPGSRGGLSAGGRRWGGPRTHPRRDPSGPSPANAEPARRSTRSQSNSPRSASGTRLGRLPCRINERPRRVSRWAAGPRSSNRSGSFHAYTLRPLSI